VYIGRETGNQGQDRPRTLRERKPVIAGAHRRAAEWSAGRLTAHITMAPHANESETSETFPLRGCGEFAPQLGCRKATAGGSEITDHNSPQIPQEPPQLPRVRRRGSYGEAIRTGRSAMTQKRQNPISASPALSPSEYEDAVAAFIRNKGITRCPTACLVRTQASVPAADGAALERYEAERDRSRRENFAAGARLLGVIVRQSAEGRSGQRPNSAR
jgi:hypothetical protein